ncbi:MAG: hypothetical protein KDE15_12620 [Erythrobacter sp.]|nr:hypothetical protein [Erythrobacter sp.]
MVYRSCRIDSAIAPAAWPCKGNLAPSQDFGPPLPHFCRAYGLTLRSDIPLDGTLAAPAGAFDVDVVEGPVPARADPVEAETLRWTGNARELVLHIPRVGRFHVTDGRRITYAPVTPGAADPLGLYVLGSALGAVLHQRGQQLLHASCVELGGKAVAICGRRGAGKSTTAAMLCRQGARLLTDDVAVFARLDPPWIVPGYPQAKLTGEALARIDRDPAQLRPLHGERGKFAVPRAEIFVDQPLPLHAVMVIERSDRATPVMARMKPAPAIQALLRHTYRPHFVMPSQAQRDFAGWGKVVEQVPMFELRRPRQGDSTAFVVSAIQQAIATIAESQA